MTVTDPIKLSVSLWNDSKNLILKNLVSMYVNEEEKKKNFTLTSKVILNYFLFLLAHFK